MQHGFYINMRDPAFDYVGVEDFVLRENADNPTDTEDRGNPRGIVPIWRARAITEYKAELLPPEPVPVPVHESEESLLDILDYLQRQYDKTGGQDEEESRPVPSPVPEEIQLDIPDIDFDNL